MRDTICTLLLIFVGGGLGSLARYALSFYNSNLPHILPFGTMFANVLSCATLGLLTGIYIARPDISATHRLFWATGFCGGFSTFSTFMLENKQIIDANYISLSLLYMLISVLACYVALHIGLSIGKAI